MKKVSRKKDEMKRNKIKFETYVKISRTINRLIVPKNPIQSSSIYTSAFVGVGSLRRSPPLHNALSNFQIEVQLTPPLLCV
jgi:hypothetical protein